MDKSKKHILIVEDNEDILLMVKMMLTMKGYEVSTRDNAHQLESFISELCPDLLIMDMLLSGADGRDICSGLKNNSAVSHLPILMMSAHPTAKETSMNAGADDFISKPFDMEGLLLKISRLTNKEQQL